MNRKPVEILTNAECCALLSHILYRDGARSMTPTSLRNECITLLMLDAGLRVGEVVKLKLANVHYDGLVTMAVRVSEDVAKRHVERIVPMTVRLRKNLCDYIKWHPLVLIESPVSYLFRNPRTAKRLTERFVRYFIGRAGYKALGRQIHPHMLRHTFATRLMKQTNARVVQKLLGHANLSTTQIYTHPNTEDLKNAINGLNHDQTKDQTQKMENAANYMADPS